MRGGYDGPTMGAHEGTGDFGGELRRYRESAGLSQEELAERAGLTAKGISALERGERQRPYPQTVRALAEALNLSDADRTTLIGAIPRRARSERDDKATTISLSVRLVPPSEPTPLLATPTKASTRLDSLTSPLPATHRSFFRRSRACCRLRRPSGVIP
jgi:transcriptional regulator with XRE-family HTH domain